MDMVVGSEVKQEAIPYADFNREIPDKTAAMEKIDLTMLTDILQPVFTGGYGRCEAWFSRIYQVQGWSIRLKLSIIRSYCNSSGE
jgi:hypothetical protein